MRESFLMLKRNILFAVIILLSAVSIQAISIDLKISGPGVVNDSTIKAGEVVNFDIYFKNQSNFRGFSVGFKFFSSDINQVVHVTDKGNGVNLNGDIKAFNGWQDMSVWDFGGLFTIESDWDGKMPELIGLGGISKSKSFTPQKSTKNVSMQMIFNEAGSITVDSSFFPPAGRWIFSIPPTKPAWGGPYNFKVVK